MRERGSNKREPEMNGKYWNFNPKCYYPHYELLAKLRFEKTVIRVAKEAGNDNHPAVIQAEKNITDVERYLENG